MSRERPRWLSAIKPALTVSGMKSLLMSSVDQPAPWNGIVASDGRLNLFLAALDAGGDIPPTVSLTSPVNGSKFTAPATTTVNATASDPDGTVTKVDFYANGSPDRHRHDEPLCGSLGRRPGGRSTP